ncbi:DUF418 domain-containing protein [Brevundimonas sp.]|jgi:uncharacterized protein|uniref:DUF418 domain-containing protein n=1 Tax=Brevundimonas sp. TaxID=1871086 RepID=UPI0037C1AA21
MSEATTPAARVQVIDTLRALALYGVITMNLMAMVMGLIGAEIVPKAGPIDYVFATFDLVLLQGKARSTFALLFGVGFGMLMVRAAQRGQAFTGFYLRRMSALLLFGLINLAVLFWGDILILYALLGMVLLLFRGWSNRAILAAGLILVIGPPLALGLFEAATGAPAPNLAGLTPEQAEGVMSASAPIYRAGDGLAYVRANLAYYVDHHLTDTAYAFVYELGVLGLFLLGLWTARTGVLAGVEAWRPFLRRVAWICLPVGLVLSALHASRRMGIDVEGAAYALVSAAYVGLPIMAFGYVAILALLLTRGGRFLQPLLSPMGRMALSGYLASNAIGSFVWYGWGLGLMGRTNVTGMNLFALAVFGSLCVFSAVWLSVFRFGPVEWLWRCLSYARWQPLLRRK